VFWPRRRGLSDVLAQRLGGARAGFLLSTIEPEPAKGAVESAGCLP